MLTYRISHQEFFLWLLLHLLPVIWTAQQTQWQYRECKNIANLYISCALTLRAMVLSKKNFYVKSFPVLHDRILDNVHSVIRIQTVSLSLNCILANHMKLVLIA